MQDDPNPTKAKMLALLALLDVLEGNGEMTAVGTDKVGANDRFGRGGKIRLRFTVFGDETKLLALAHELTLAGSHEAMLRMVDGLITRGDKVRFATRMISAWTEVINRLVSKAEIRELAEPGPDRVDERLAVDVNLDAHGNRTVRRLPEGKP